MKRLLSNLARYPAPMRIGAFLLLLALVWAPIAVPVYWLVTNPTAVTILTLVPLYLEFIVLVRVWGRYVHAEPHILRLYGLQFSRRFGHEWLSGIAIGVFSVGVLFLTQGVAGSVVWQPPAATFGRIVGEGFVVASAFGFAEELLFRGWLLDELQRDYAPRVALWSDATVFALVHGLRPQFPALVLLGVMLGWAKRSRVDFIQSWRRYSKRSVQRLGLSMGLHAGLVWGYYIVNVGQLVRYTDRVPAWITGIDHNPLAGLIGLSCLGLLALGVRRFAAQRSPE